MADAGNTRVNMSWAAFVIVALLLVFDVGAGFARGRPNIVTWEDLVFVALLAGLSGVAVKLSKDGLQVNEPQAAEHLEKAEEKRQRKITPKTAKERVRRARAPKEMRLLWVDDNPDNNVQETLMLEKLGFRITHTTSTESGLDYLASIPYDLVITDLTRQDNPRAGLELLSQIPKVGNVARTIVYAGQKDDRAKEAMDLGAVAVTTQPQELLEAIAGTVLKQAA